MHDKGVWLNPNVRVAYRVKRWELVRQGVGWSGNGEDVAVGFVSALLGLPWGMGRRLGGFWRGGVSLG